MVNKAILLISLGLVLVLSLLILPTISDSIDTARGGVATDSFTATEDNLTPETFTLASAGTVSSVKVNGVDLTDSKEEGDSFTGYELATCLASDNTTNHSVEITTIMTALNASIDDTDTTLYIEYDGNILVQDGDLAHAELSYYEAIADEDIAIRDNGNGNVIIFRNDTEYEYVRFYNDIQYSTGTITIANPACLYVATSGTPFDYYIEGANVIITADRVDTGDTVAITYSSVRDLGGASGMLDLVPIAIVASILLGATLVIKRK